MLITSHYNETTRTEKAWYSSSNIFYSMFVEDATENWGDLYVTFNNGATYKYKKVQIAPDYVMFKHGGLEGSHGKALNAHIKPKYEFEKVGNMDISDLAKQKDLLIMDQEVKEMEKTYFISGHRNITEEQFSRYKKAIAKVLEKTPDARFVVGDYQGVDIMAQDFLLNELSVSPENVTVYHMFETPRNVNPNVIKLVGGFETDEQRDAAMTEVSRHDIAFVTDHTKLSGTAQNILRRHLF